MKTIATVLLSTVNCSLHKHSRYRAADKTNKEYCYGYYQISLFIAVYPVKHQKPYSAVGKQTAQQGRYAKSSVDIKLGEGYRYCAVGDKPDKGSGYLA